MLQQAQPQSNEWLQWLAVFSPLFMIFLQALAPRIAQWRREHAEDQKVERQAAQEQRRIEDMQSAGWEKLYLIQEDMINRLQQEVTEKNLIIASLQKTPKE